MKIVKALSRNLKRKLFVTIYDAFRQTFLRQMLCGVHYKRLYKHTMLMFTVKNKHNSADSQILK